MNDIKYIHEAKSKTTGLFLLLSLIFGQLQKSSADEFDETLIKVRNHLGGISDLAESYLQSRMEVIGIEGDKEVLIRSVAVAQLKGFDGFSSIFVTKSEIEAKRSLQERLRKAIVENDLEHMKALGVEYLETSRAAIIEKTHERLVVLAKNPEAKEDRELQSLVKKFGNVTGYLRAISGE